MCQSCVDHTEAQIRRVIVVVVVIVKAHVYWVDRGVNNCLFVRTNVGTGDQLKAAKVGGWSFGVSVTLSAPIWALLDAKDVLTAVKVHLGRVLT